MTNTVPTQPTLPSTKGDLPDGWSITSLGDGPIYEAQTGFACGTHNREGQGIGHVRPMNVSPEGKIDLSNLKFVPTSEVTREERLVRAGDVIFNNTNSAELVGKTACYQLADPLAFSNHMTRLRCWRDAVEPQFCAMQLHQLWREGYFQKVCNHHVSQASVGTKVLLETPFLLAPLPEQTRIVAKVEALTELVNAARVRLTNVPAILKRFRQAVVAAAGSGRLSAAWRNHSEEPNRLLAEIATARAIRIAKTGTRKRLRDGRPSEIHAHELSESGFPETPGNWLWARCADLCQPERAFTYGIIKLGVPVEDGIPTLRSSDVRWLHIEQDRVKRVSPDVASKFARTFLQGGEVLVTVRGTLGGVAFAPAHLKGYNVSREVAVVPVEPLLEPEFIAITVAAEWSQNWLAGVAKGVAYTGVNIEDLRRLPIPVPPVAEQREIVRRVKALFDLADGIEANVRAATIRAERLPQAILARALSGQLVPTEAQLAAEQGREYETASALLERIKGLRKQQPAERGHGGKMTKRSNRQAHKNRRPLREILREQGKPLTPERLFALAGYDEDTVDEFYEQLRGLVQKGVVRESRPNGTDVTLEAV